MPIITPIRPAAKLCRMPTRASTSRAAPPLLAPTAAGSYVFTDAYTKSLAGVLVVSSSAKPVPTSSFSLAPGP